MSDVTQLLANNQAWAARMTGEDPAFFQRLEAQQTPGYFWIGCSDSRVPATQLVGLLPGEMFVHRNVANVVVHSDLNCLAALHFAVDVLRVQHVIVCGHYSCSGVAAALHNQSFGLVDNWLRHVQDVRNKHAALLSACRDEPHQLRRLCELNVLEQVVNVCQTTIVQGAWQREQRLAVYGWIYGLGDGIVRDLAITIAQPVELVPQFTQALRHSAAR